MIVSLVNAPINKVFNSEVNLDSQLSSGYNSSTTHSSIVADIDMGLIMVYRLYNWSSAFYFGGGYAVFEYEGVPDP